MIFGFSSAATRRALIVTALSAAMLVPATSTLAAAPTGTVVGTVTCGPAQETPAPQATIAIDGMRLSTTADSAGKFTLTNVPAGQLLSVDALADPAGAVTTTRYNISIAPDTVTDIGNLDLVACPSIQPADTTPMPSTGAFGGPVIDSAPTAADYGF
jgi:hypothetical protein